MSRPICSDCGKEQPVGTLAGVCPNCLLGLGLKADESAGIEADGDGEGEGNLTASTAGLTERITEEKPGQRLGRYKLLEPIGEGGFGRVWMAEQQEPVRRRVALKILKVGMDTREIVVRFEAERQALAMMDHPNIAKVLDAGASESGRPYFIMELVGGEPITTFSDRHRLGTRQRIELFIVVCEAVQHAHQKGVIHRDLKPGNVLVSQQDGRMMPKVIDFGIAKAIEEPLTDKTLLTRFHQFLGTPSYMSPEQAGLGGLDVDTRSDIYSLGVLIYELVTGAPPFGGPDLAAQGREAALRVIRESEPPRPSTRLTTLSRDRQTEIAARRQETPQQTVSFVRGELDWIVLKAIEKDRARRYATASGFAADLRRHLNGDPVSAAPPTLPYRFSKFSRKHRIALGVTAAFAALIISGIVVTGWQAVRATRLAESEREQRSRAEANEHTARQRLYAAEMNVAQQAYLENNLGRAAELLEKHAPRNPLDQRPAAFWEWRHLWRNARSDEVFQVGPHSHSVASVDFSADGKSVVSGCADRLVRVWEFPTGRLAATFTHSRSIRAVVCARQGDWIAMGGHGEEVTIWDPKRNRILQSLTNGVPVLALALTKDDRILAAASFRSVSLWDPLSGTLLRRLPIQHAWWLPAGLAFSPDNRSLAYDSGGGGGAILDLASGNSQPLPSPHLGEILSMVYSRDGRMLITGSHDGVVKVRDGGTGEVKSTWTNAVGFVAALAVSPDGQILATAGSDQRVRLYETPTWRELANLKGHRREIWSLAFAPDGEYLASAGSMDETVRIWRRETRSSLPPRVPLPAQVAALAPASDGSKVLFCYSNASWNTLDALSFEVTEPSRLDLAGPPQAAALGPEAHLAIADANGAVWLFEGGRGTATKRLAGPGIKLTQLMFSAAGRYVAGLRLRQTVEVWNWDGESVLTVLPSPAKASLEIRAFALSRSGRTLAVGFNSGEVEVYDVPSRERKARFREHRWMVVEVAISPDEETVASSGAEGRIKLYDLPSGSVRATLTGQLSVFSSLGFSPSGDRLAAGGDRGNVVIWDVTSREPLELARLRDGSQDSVVIQFSDDGRSLISFGLTHGQISELMIWQAASWNEVR